MCEEPGVKGKGGGRVNCDAIMSKLDSVWLSEKGREGVQVNPVLANVKHTVAESTHGTDRMERASRMQMRGRKEKEAQALAASKRNQIAGFRLLGVGEKARHLDGNKEGGRSPNTDSLDSVGDGTVRREAFWAGVNDLNDSFEGSKGFKLRC